MNRTSDIAIFVLFLLALAASACTDTEQFRVNGEIAGKETMNLRVTYYTAGGVKTLVTAARDGKFEFFGSSQQPTLVEITDYEYRPLARLYASNGETFDIKVDRSEPLKGEITGNDITERWSSFLRDNADVLQAGGTQANEAIARYVAGHGTDIVSSLLLLTAYDASENAMEADSLLSLIAPEGRPSGILDGYNMMLQRLVAETATDTIRPFYYEYRDTARLLDPADRPVTIIAFTDDAAKDYETVADSLEKAVAKSRAVFDLRAIGTLGFSYSDTIRRSTGRLPGGLSARGVERLGIPSLPYYIVTDSAGVQYYRGEYLHRAQEVADSLSKTR